MGLLVGQKKNEKDNKKGTIVIVLREYLLVLEVLF